MVTLSANGDWLLSLYKSTSCDRRLMQGKVNLSAICDANGRPARVEPSRLNLNALIRFSFLPVARDLLSIYPCLPQGVRQMPAGAAFKPQISV
jgi:hypothetical protein